MSTPLSSKHQDLIAEACRTKFGRGVDVTFAETKKSKLFFVCFGDERGARRCTINSTAVAAHAAAVGQPAYVCMIKALYTDNPLPAAAAPAAVAPAAAGVVPIKKRPRADAKEDDDGGDGMSKKYKGGAGGGAAGAAHDTTVESGDEAAASANETHDDDEAILISTTAVGDVSSGSTDDVQAYAVDRQLHNAAAGDTVSVWRSHRCGDPAVFECVGGVGSLAPATILTAHHAPHASFYQVRIDDVVVRSTSNRVYRDSVKDNRVCVSHVFDPIYEPSLNNPGGDDPACTDFFYGSHVEMYVETARGYGRWLPAVVVGRRCASDTTRRCNVSSAVGTCDLPPPNARCAHESCMYVLHVDNDERARVDVSPCDVRAPTAVPHKAPYKMTAAMTPLALSL